MTCGKTACRAERARRSVRARYQAAGPQGGPKPGVVASGPPKSTPAAAAVDPLERIREADRRVQERRAVSGSDPVED